MGAGRNTEAIDRITPKSPGGLRVVFSKNAANETDVPLGSLGDNDYITKKMFLNNASGTPPVQATFTSATGFTINWQTDIPSGYSNTYEFLLGDTFPKPMVFVNTGTRKDSLMNSYSMDVNRNVDGSIDTIVFDWGDSQTGTIQF